MNRYLLVGIMVIALAAGVCASAILYIQLGLSWLHEGYGLNPYIAFPMAALSVASTFLIPPIARLLYRVIE